jgi:hypothetical protein
MLTVVSVDISFDLFFILFVVVVGIVVVVVVVVGFVVFDSLSFGTLVTFEIFAICEGSGFAKRGGGVSYRLVTNVGLPVVMDLFFI